MRVSIALLLEKSISRFRAQGDTHVIETDIPSQIPPVEADEVLLGRVVNNLLEVMVDSTKMMRIMRRPHPEVSSSSGPWNSVLGSFIHVMILTNCAVFAFRLEKVKEAFEADTLQERFLVFGLALFVMYFIKYVLIRTIVETFRDESLNHLKRQERVWPFLVGLEKPMSIPHQTRGAADCKHTLNCVYSTR